MADATEVTITLGENFGDVKAWAAKNGYSSVELASLALIRRALTDAVTQSINGHVTGKVGQFRDIHGNMTFN